MDSSAETAQGEDAARLAEELGDLQVLYETTAAHSAALEAELERQSARAGDLETRNTELTEELSDLQVLYETTVEHGSSLENELMRQNERMEDLQGKMRKYLSPQLYQSLVGGRVDAGTRGHQRVRLTVYFSDMVGFSNLTDAIEPELLSDLLNTYLTRMTEIALRHGGTVDKFVGDAIMVFFGAPEFIDDTEHARSCVQMAIEMQDEIARLRERWRTTGIDQPLQIRAGINTGFCTVGNFGSENRMDYTIIGGQVNLAARLQSLAPPDHIYISGATYALVEELVLADALGPMTFKGIHAPVEVWDIRGLRSDLDMKSTYLSIEGGRLRMGEIDIDPAEMTSDQRAALRRALQHAIERLG